MPYILVLNVTLILKYTYKIIKTYIYFMKNYITSIVVEKLRENILGWLGHVLRRDETGSKTIKGNVC